MYTQSQIKLISQMTHEGQRHNLFITSNYDDYFFFWKSKKWKLW